MNHRNEGCAPVDGVNDEGACRQRGAGIETDFKITAGASLAKQYRRIVRVQKFIVLAFGELPADNFRTTGATNSAAAGVRYLYIGGEPGGQ
ncbi:hypothetical protein QO207_21845 [Pseudomonas sp. CAN2814]|nr:hypothetical protein [Pseudomonas sp. CAN1]MDN6859244.1 hypothetical protein [Pseudomonas sp. CAN1]